MSEDTALTDPKAFEKEVIKETTQRPVPVDSVIKKAQALRDAKKEPPSERVAQALQLALVETNDFENLIRLLKVQAEWANDSISYGLTLPALLRAATKDRMKLVAVESSGFGKVPPSEAFARLEKLLSMKPNTYFFDKTWGFGIVKRADDFYKRIVIDFSAKRNHQMSMEYAACALEPVSSSHILARFHTEPEAIKVLLVKHPGEIVKMVLESFGPSTVIRLEHLLEEYGVLDSKDWKSFWSHARADLKNQKLVVIPAKRSAPLVLRDKPLDYGEEWFEEELAVERNIPALFESISAYEAAKDKPDISDNGRKILTDRLNFAIDGAFLCPPPMFTRLVLMAQRLNIDTPKDELCDKLLDDKRFMEAGDKLSSKESKEMIDFLLETRPDTVGILLEELPEMSFNLTCQTLDELRANGDYLKAVQDRCRDLLTRPQVPSAMLVWALRNWDELDNWGLPTLYELLEHAIAIIEDHTLAGEKLRIQHLLHGFYANINWFDKVFTSLNNLQREALFYRIYGNTNFGDPTLQRHLVDEMVEIYPALENKKFTTSEEKKEPVALRYTSWRMLRYRQTQFKHLIEVEIPKNRDDIAYARGLGDLRENFEYQSAKDQQRVLMARREEMDADLKTMHGTAFDEATDLSVVGMGVKVVLVKADGSESSYTILGEWDSDEDLSILPNRSKLALALLGKHASETATVPTLGGEETVTIRQILPIDSDVRAWLETTAGFQAE